MNTPPVLRPVASDGDEPARRVTIDRRCRECGYGIATRQLPIACPMCRATAWEPIRRHAWAELDLSQ